jgi:hypothetical protein
MPVSFGAAFVAGRKAKALIDSQKKNDDLQAKKAKADEKAQAASDDRNDLRDRLLQAEADRKQEAHELTMSLATQPKAPTISEGIALRKEERGLEAQKIEGISASHPLTGMSEIPGVDQRDFVQEAFDDPVTGPQLTRLETGSASDPEDFTLRIEKLRAYQKNLRFEQEQRALPQIAQKYLDAKYLNPQEMEQVQGEINDAGDSDDMALIHKRMLEAKEGFIQHEADLTETGKMISQGQEYIKNATSPNENRHVLAQYLNRIEHDVDQSMDEKREMFQDLKLESDQPLMDHVQKAVQGMAAQVRASRSEATSFGGTPALSSDRGGQPVKLSPEEESVGALSPKEQSDIMEKVHEITSSSDGAVKKKRLVRKLFSDANLEYLDEVWAALEAAVGTQYQ